MKGTQRGKEEGRREKEDTLSYPLTHLSFVPYSLPPSLHPSSRDIPNIVTTGAGNKRSNTALLATHLLQSNVGRGIGEEGKGLSDLPGGSTAGTGGRGGEGCGGRRRPLELGLLQGRGGCCLAEKERWMGWRTKGEEGRETVSVNPSSCRLHNRSLFSISGSHATSPSSQ
jgi:hypothetical protein